MNEPTMDTPAAEAPASIWEDFIDIFYAPRQVFARRRNAGFGLVLLVLTILLTVIFYASQGPLAEAMAAEFRRAMEQGGPGGQQMTAEQMATAQRMGAIFGTLGMLIVLPISAMLVGVILWALGKLFDFSASISAAILIVTYAWFPRVPQSIVTLLEGLLFNPATLAETSIGPARFFDPATTAPALMALLMRADVFYIWSTVLIAIGAQVIGRVQPARSYLLAVLVWLIGALPTVVPPLLR